MGDEVGTCHSCGTPLTDGVCVICRERALERVGIAQAQIDRGREKGAEMKQAEDLLVGARLMLESGSFEDALHFAEESRKLAFDMGLTFETLVTTIKRSERAIREAAEVGGDTTVAASLLDDARKAMEENEYKRGVTYAIRSCDAADKEKRKYESWKVDVDGWLKTK